MALVRPGGDFWLRNQAFERAFPREASACARLDDFTRQAFEPRSAAALRAAAAGDATWRGRLASATASWLGPPDEPASFDVSVTPLGGGEGPREGTLLTFRDVTELIREERLQVLSAEGEKARSDVAWAMSVDVPLPERCAVALASILQMQGLDLEARGMVFVRDSASTPFALLSYCGEVAPGLVPVGQLGADLSQEVTGNGAGRILATDGCLTAQFPTEGHLCDLQRPHGHYVVPLLERPDAPLGLLVLTSGPGPIRDAPRLEALTLVAELFTTAILRDRAGRSLLESSRQAEAASRAKSDFLATMSHEIRTPMNGVLGFTQLLLDSGLTPDQRENAQLIYNSAEGLLAILNDILDFSKIEAGKMMVDPRPTAIFDAAREAVGLLRAAAERKGVTLTFTADPRVPAGVLLDPQRFRQVLLNLLGNALKFTPGGAVQVALGLREGAGPTRLQVTVRDSGIGIAPEVLPTLFQKFVQADTSTSRRFGGTGLGLAISKHLVELMGGAIGAESRQGEGSTFWFTLPLLEAVVAGGLAPASEVRVRPASGRRRVLLAEDNPINQTLVRKLLERSGLGVTVAPDGVEAARLAATGDFDLVLMDCQMPVMDGYDATRAIRRHEQANPQLPRLPVIAVTASAFAEDHARCLEAGMDAVLTKPFKLHDVEATLARLGPERLGSTGS
jgi:signal transduction histidine kinase/ActR/RegA family two-component response regulator